LNTLKMSLAIIAKDFGRIVVFLFE
jgi:hypothetical protein